jgi:hypothetical protein
MIGGGMILSKGIILCMNALILKIKAERVRLCFLKTFMERELIVTIIKMKEWFIDARGNLIRLKIARWL